MYGTHPTLAICCIFSQPTRYAAATLDAQALRIGTSRFLPQSLFLAYKLGLAVYFLYWAIFWRGVKDHNTGPYLWVHTSAPPWAYRGFHNGSQRLFCRGSYSKDRLLWKVLVFSPFLRFYGWFSTVSEMQDTT